MATKDELALRLDATMWLLSAGMEELPLPLYNNLIDYREELKEALGANWAAAISGKLSLFIEANRGSDESKGDSADKLNPR